MNNSARKKFTESRDAILKLDELDKENSSKCKDLIPARFVLSIYLSIGCWFIYGLRVTLNMAIVAMVNSTSTGHELELENTTSAFESDTCSEPHNDVNDGNNTLTNKLSGSYNWSPSEQGVILGGFYYGYVATQLIGGRLGEWIGPKMVFLIGVFASSVLTLLTPLAAEWHVAALITVRILIGAFQGSAFPSIMTFLPIWYPPEELSTQLAIIMTGNQIGTIVTMMGAGYLCEQTVFAGGWPSVFYIYGTAGCIFSIFFFFFVYNKPEDHPRISAKELRFLKEKTQIQSSSTKKIHPVPWFSIFTSLPVWSLALAKMTSAFAFHVVLTRIPAYLDGVLNYSLESNGSINSLLYVCKAVSGVMAGYFSDLLQKKNILRTNATRKCFESLSLFGTATFLALIPTLRCDSLAVVAFLALAMTASGLTSGGDNPAPADMAPVFSGTLFGVCNTLAAATGFLAPMVVGVLLENDPESLTQWSYVFYSSAGICVFGACLFLVFGSAQLQPWARIEIKETDSVEEKHNN